MCQVSSSNTQFDFGPSGPKNAKGPTPIIAAVKGRGENALFPRSAPPPLPLSVAVFTRHDGGVGGRGDHDKFGRKPQIKAALKKAAGFCRGSAKTLHELNERMNERARRRVRAHLWSEQL